MPRQIQVSLILAYSEIKNSSILTNLLIIFVMVLTFLNLIFGRGILTGLPQGATQGYKNNYTGDVLISNLDNENYIKKISTITNLLDQSNYVKDYSVRYVTPMFITSDYKLKDSDQTKIFVDIALVDLQKESKYFDLNTFLIDGNFTPNKTIIGSRLLEEYSSTQGVGETSLKNTGVGDKIEISNQNVKVQTDIEGVIKSKVTQVERKVYVSKNDYVTLVGQNHKNTAKEIAVILIPGVDINQFVSSLKAKGINEYAQVKTFEQAQPQFLNDIKTTFSVLGDVIGGVGLFISCITIFIIIYVNAVNKRRNIGILKGIGIPTSTIVVSFIFQALFYSLFGSLIGMFLLFAYIVPFFTKNPLDFPFADGVLLAPVDEVLVRFFVLTVASVISGFIPAFLITKQKTINAILMR